MRDNENITMPDFISQEDWDKARRFVELPTGIRLSYVEMGNPEGETIVLQHGMTDNNRVWSLSAPYFCEAGYHIYMPDLRGMGYSDQPDGFYTIFDYASDIKAFMDVMRIDKAYMVGHSLGSGAMQAFWLMYPEKCIKLALVASGPIDEGVAKSDIYQMMKALKPEEHPSDAFIDIWYGNQNHVPQDFLRRVKAESQRLSAKSWVNITGGVAVSNMKAMYPMLDKNIPVLLMSAEKDGIISERARDILKSYIPFSDFKLYEGIGHNIQYEIPRQFAQDLICWLKTGKL